MIKSYLLIFLLLILTHHQNINGTTITPVKTTRSTLTDYSFHFYTDTAIHSNAQVAISFPFEFSSSTLNKATRVQYAVGSGNLTKATWSVSNRMFKIEILPNIPIGNITILIDGITNPQDYDTSS